MDTNHHTTSITRFCEALFPYRSGLYALTPHNTFR